MGVLRILQKWWYKDEDYSLNLGQAIGIPDPGKQVAQSVELPARTSDWETDQESRGISKTSHLDESKTDIVYYWLFLPTDYEVQAKSGGAPLLLFLHGGRWKNTPAELAKTKARNLPCLLETTEFAKKFPSIAVAPLCKSGSMWSPSQLMLLLDHIEENYKIDKSRVYVMGHSMGGFGTWMCLNKSPERFAAAVPICGGGRPEWAGRLVNTPIWAFHGDNDSVVTIDNTSNMVEAITKAGGKSIRFTIYERAGHDIGTRTYSNPMLYDWMFRQSLKGIDSINFEV